MLIEADDPAERELGIDRLRALRLVYDAKGIASAYQGTEDATRRRRMAEAFRCVTGVTIEDWLDMVND